VIRPARPDEGERLREIAIAADSMGGGIGTQLLRFAAERARELGARTMEWDAEPHAVGFYELMGGRYLRDGKPSEWGRILPVMGVDL
jgi:GNAT superfamily N-acetyltransferase